MKPKFKFMKKILAELNNTITALEELGYIKQAENLNDIFIKKYLEDFIFVNLKLNKYNIEHRCESDDCRDCECSICSNKNNTNKLITNCNHVFDRDCLLKWIDIDLTQNNKISCPYCRSNL